MRGAELMNIPIQRILGLPNKRGLKCNFQWGKTQRHGADHLLTIPYDEDGALRGSLPVTTATMSSALKHYASVAGETQEFSLHSFRSAGAVSRALAGGSSSTIMQRVYWKSTATVILGDARVCSTLSRDTQQK